jgi:hypothetical protein
MKHSITVTTILTTVKFVIKVELCFFVNENFIKIHHLVKYVFIPLYNFKRKIFEKNKKILINHKKPHRTVGEYLQLLYGFF